MKTDPLYWLPEDSAWTEKANAAAKEPPSEALWQTLVGLAGARMNFLRVNRLDAALRKAFPEGPPKGLSTRPVRLAVLGSCTLTHLLPAIRVAALRRNIWVTIHEGDFGLYLQELHDSGSAVHAFRPDVTLLAFDAPHLFGGVDAASDAAGGEAALGEAVNRIAACWTLIREQVGGDVIQQTVLNTLPALLGENEHRLPGSGRDLVRRLNAELRARADAARVDLLAVDDHAAQDGLGAWHDPILWRRAKQDVTPAIAPLYGDLVGRILAARQGLSRKCLVLDLDNTLWGGVIGDDGLEGIELGQGTTAGEAFVAFQSYAKSLSKRGVILAVCSKNDEANALSPFESHPEMILKRGDIACFVANWQDKASNIRAIAKELNIGVDSLVFADDNPFERNLVRQELPMVAVPELPEDAAYYAQAISDAGYFEGLAVTEEDRERSGQYQANAARQALMDSVTDMGAYLRGLDMRLIWRRFDAVGLQRVTQLINKTNQFNLTTQRYTEAEVRAIMEDPRAFGLQLRLVDRFGDNGIIAIVIGRLDATGETVDVDTWLMSCRVLGRNVEEATLNLVAAEAKRLGAARLTAAYRPTKKNGMVAKHYDKLGFARTGEGAEGTTYEMSLADFAPRDTFIVFDGP